MAKFKVGDLIYDSAKPSQKGMVYSIGYSSYGVKHRGRITPMVVAKATARYMPPWMLVKYFKGRDRGDPLSGEINSRTRRIRQGWSKKTFVRRRKLAEQKCKTLGRILRSLLMLSDYGDRASRTGPPS